MIEKINSDVFKLDNCFVSFNISKYDRNCAAIFIKKNRQIFVLYKTYDPVEIDVLRNLVEKLAIASEFVKNK